MGLETATFVSGLTPSWPLAGDPKNQGDDHIRLIKAALQATFPQATKPFYFPTTQAITTTLGLAGTDQNKLVTVDTSAGNVAVTLPTLGSGDAGWECEVVKTTGDVNAAIVSPASGTISTKVGAVATVRVGILCEPCRFKWTGSFWLAIKPGPMIGSVESNYNSSLPVGYLEADGSAFSSTSFAELFAARASSNLPNINGRAEIGRDASATILTATSFSTPGTVGTPGGADAVTLTTPQIPSHSHANTLTDPGHVHTVGGDNGNLVKAGGGSQYGGGAFGNPTAAVSVNAAFTGITINNVVAGGGGAHTNVQPSIITRKIIRAC